MRPLGIAEGRPEDQRHENQQERDHSGGSRDRNQCHKGAEDGGQGCGKPEPPGIRVGSPHGRRHRRYGL